MKKRIIPSILISNGTEISLSQKFNPWRTIGSLVQNLRLHNGRDADEILVIHPSKSNDGSSNLPSRFFQLIRNELNIPVTYVGGISDMNQAAHYINSGFDKIYVSSILYSNPQIIYSIVNTIGSQSVGLSLPYKTFENKRMLFNYKTHQLTDMTLEDGLQAANDLGIGEVHLHSVDHDGLLSGLDVEITDLLNEVQPDIPILIAGGASCPQDFVNVLKNKYIRGVVASSIFALREYTPNIVRDVCLSNGIAMRRVKQF